MKLLDDPQRHLAEGQAGEPDWNAIYRVVRDPMYRAVWRVLRPHRSYAGVCDDDIVMTAFEELRRRGLEGVTSLIGFAACIARRRALDVLGRSEREIACPHLDDTEEIAMVKDELRRERLYLRAIACIEELTPRQRVAFEETILRRRSVQEVARDDLDGVTTQAVYKLRLAAIRNLLECVGLPDEATSQ